MVLELFNTVLKLSTAGIAAGIIILFIKTALGKGFTPRWHHVIWFLLIIKLIMPVTISSSMSIFNVLKPINKISMNYKSNNLLGTLNKINNTNVVNSNLFNEKSTGNSENQNTTSSSAPGALNSEKQFNPWIVVAYVWFIGFILMLSYTICSYLNIYFRIMKNKVEIHGDTYSLIQGYINDFKLTKNISIKCVNGFSSPFAFWWFGSQIVIPLNVILNMDDKALKSIVAHEAMHIKWKDHIIRIIMLIVLSIHWFNPVVWACFKRMSKDCECACDAEVIKDYSEEMRKDYAAILIEMFENQNPKAVINPVLSLNGSNLKKRVVSIMKYKKYSVPVISLAIVILIITSVVILTDGHRSSEVVNSKPNDVSTLENSSTDIENKVEELLAEIITNGPKSSSNPYDYIANNQSFEELASLGEPALNYMFESFYKSNEDGIRDYIMACACAKIIGTFDAERGIGISSGREWFYKYSKIYKIPTSLQAIDADVDIFPKNSSEKGTVLLPEKVDKKNMEEVIEYYILGKNRFSYSRGEKAIEAHKIYRTEEKDGITSLYMQVRFGWFGFENGSFTLVSGSGGIPLRMQLKKAFTGEYEVIEYKEAMDGGMWATSIREMFPKDIAELVIPGDKVTNTELSNIQAAKAEKYLAEINRPNTLEKENVSKHNIDEKLQKAIYMVAHMKSDFPDWIGTREMLIRGGGPYPGIKIRCIFETNCTEVGKDDYEVMLTKKWDITINDKQPISYWRYKITGNHVELIDFEDNDDLIATIK